MDSDYGQSFVCLTHAMNEFTFYVICLSIECSWPLHYCIRTVEFTSMLFWSGFIVVASMVFFLLLGCCSSNTFTWLSDFRLPLCSTHMIFLSSLGVTRCVQNIVFYLIYLNTNRHVLVQLLHFPAES